MMMMKQHWSNLRWSALNWDNLLLMEESNILENISVNQK